VNHRRPSFERERALWSAGLRLVAGVDEAGRGPLAGPVVAAAVVFPADARGVPGLRDSKLLSPRRRERVAALVRRRALAVAVAAASVREIDRYNIRRATVLAMRRAIRRLPSVPDHILVDGLPLPELMLEHDAIVDGDARCQSIAAASVIAKTVRDRLMDRLAPRYAAYGWASNRGYATDDHLTALALRGPTPHHRWSFEPVAQLRLI
jgi:ribonuclease HII